MPVYLCPLGPPTTRQDEAALEIAVATTYGREAEVRRELELRLRKVETLDLSTWSPR